MSEYTVPLIVVSGVGLLLAVILSIRIRQGRIKSRRLSSYCRKRGYAFSYGSGKYNAWLRVEGPSFTLTANQETRSKENHWLKSTLWQAERQGRDLPSFVMGVFPNQTNLPALSKQKQEWAIDNLRLEYQIPQSQACAYMFGDNGKPGIFSFADTKEKANGNLKRYAFALSDWPRHVRLLAKAQYGFLHMELPNYFLDDVEMLERLERVNGFFAK